MDTERKSRAKSGRKGHWSAVDTAVLLLALLAIAGIVYRVIYAAGQRTERGEAAMYAISFEVAETHADVLSEIKGFDSIYLTENNARLGYIGVYKEEGTDEYRVALTVSPAEGATDPDRVVARGTLICTDGILSDGSLLVSGSGIYLTPGSEIEVRTDRARITLCVTDISAHN